MSKKARYLVHFIFFYTCIEGLVINIEYPSKLPFIYKDVLILILYLMVFLSARNKQMLHSPAINKVVPALLAFSMVMGVYMLMPGTHPLGGLVALKQRLFYIPLLGIGYIFVRSEEDLGQLLKLMVVCAIGVSLFGIYLYFRGPDGLRALGATYSAEIKTPAFREAASESVYWRVPSTFNSPGQYGNYLFFNSLIAIALLMTKVLTKKWKVVTAASLALMILAILGSGSRSPIVMLSASVVFLLLLSRQLKRVVAGFFVTYVVLVFGFTFFGAGVEDRFASILSYEQIERFQGTYFGQLFLPALMKDPLGTGLGCATIGARHLSDLNQPISMGSNVNRSEQNFLLTESYFGILAIETGMFGLVTFLWVCVVIGLLLFKSRKLIRSSPLALPVFALTIYVLFTLLVLPVSTAIDHAPMNLYFWFPIGVVVKIAEIEKRKRLVAQASERQRIAYQATLVYR